MVDDELRLDSTQLNSLIIDLKKSILWRFHTSQNYEKFVKEKLIAERGVDCQVRDRDGEMELIVYLYV